MMRRKKTLLITGGSGYLGRHLTAKAVEAFEVFTTYSTLAGQIKAGRPLPLDLTDREAVLRLIANLAPQAIIHTAAINPGRGDDEAMRRVNADGSRYVAEGAAAAGARLVHVSTDVVHDGRHAPYADEARPTPVNEYGRSKAAAEAVVAEVAPQAAIVRTSLIYGLTEMDRGTESFVKRLEAGQPLVLFSDVIRQPVWVDSLAEALLKLVEIDFAGILNVAGRQALTREEFGRRMLAWWQVDPRGLLQSGCATDVSDTIPLDLRLNISKAEQLLQMSLPGVDEVVTRASVPS
ncbi:MAG: sugar nucleotide-binding protein [Anaerolineales bacterium]|nr:sugar nucleotide-binding protein [Anaerolineales bacterium]